MNLRSATPRSRAGAFWGLSATDLLILLISASFLASLPLPSVGFLGFSQAGLVRGEVWTLVTSIFVHADLFQLAVNMFFLYVFGNAVEREVGPGMALAMFFVSGVASLVAGIPFYSPETRIIGSSIAVSAMVGGSLVLVDPERPSSALLFFAPLGLVALVYMIFNAFMLLQDQSGGVAWPSHVIGFFVGAVLGMAWRGRPSPQSRDADEGE